MYMGLPNMTFASDGRFWSRGVTCRSSVASEDFFLLLAHFVTMTLTVQSVRSADPLDRGYLGDDVV